MNEFRRDVTGWKLELARLKAEGQIELVATIEDWTNEAERVLTRWKRKLAAGHVRFAGVVQW